LSGPSVRAGA